jgi:hypothetical protein
MAQRIGTEEIVGEYRGFKQARKRTIQEQTETFESALYYPVGRVKKWLYKFWFWRRGLAQPAERAEDTAHIALADLGKVSASDIVAIRELKLITANNVTLAVLIPYGRWEEWKKIIDEARKKEESLA